MQEIAVREVSANSGYHVEEDVKYMTHFGWKLKNHQKETVNTENTFDIVETYTFVRETNTPWHDEMCKLQKQYEKLKGFNEKSRFNFDIFRLLLMCFIIPGLIYLLVKMLIKILCRGKVQENKEKMQAILKKADQILRRGR